MRFLLSFIAVTAFAQYPLITVQGPAKPTIQVGSQSLNIGTVNYFLGSGAPGTVALSEVGDVFLNSSNQEYRCFAGTNPCTSWVQITGSGGGGAPTGPAGGSLSGSYRNPGLASVVTAATCGDATHIPVATFNAAGQITACTPTSFTGTVLLKTNGTNNSTQTTLNLAAGTGMSLVESSGTVTISNNSLPVFQTNTVNNATQTLLNLIAGTNIGLVNSGGNVTITCTGCTGGGGGGTVTTSGTITNGALVTAAGPTAIQTPSSTSILDSSGNLTVAGFVKGLDTYPTVLQTAGCDPTGVSDSTTCFNNALTSAAGSVLVIPKGTYKIGQINIPAGTTMVGYGTGTVLNRNGAITAGSGWIDLNNHNNIRISNLLMDGQVTSSTGVDYITVTDPLQANLVLNTSIRIHGGSNIEIDHIVLQHTGGYAILIDSTTNNTANVNIHNNTFQDNRPFLFGTGSDLTYGAWPGGILWHSNGSTANIQNLWIVDNVMQRISGNAVWGHASATTLLNKSITVSRNKFQDIGLDAAQATIVDGYTASDNTFLRIGYVSTSDGATGAPKWFNAVVSGVNTSIPSAAIDSTNLVLDFTITGNTVLAHNGGCLELDGSGYGSVTGNHCAIPQSGDPEYADAQPSSWGPAVGPGIGSPGQNWMYGLQTGNSNNNTFSASHISISGNSFYGQGGGAIRLYAAKYVIAENNVILTPSTIFIVPIVIGPRNGTNARAYGNEVANNKITYTGTGTIIAVAEDSQYASFQSGDINRVHDNVLIGNMSDFGKDTNSSSINYGASTVLSGTCSGTAACTTISKVLTSNSTYGAPGVASIVTQNELSGGNYLYRWYSPGGVLMGTISTDGSFRLGDGASIGSLWAGGSLAMDVTRNFFGNSLSVSGSVAISSGRDAYLHSLNFTTGLAIIDASQNAFFNSVSINGTLVIDNTQGLHAAGGITTTNGTFSGNISAGAVSATSFNGTGATFLGNVNANGNFVHNGSAGSSATIVIGSCTLTVAGGIITGHAGC